MQERYGMDKKYQFFISSTFEDLKEERKKVMDTILSMNQFPAGMEMFSAADEEQWQIIKETIDVSDYYILIVGMKYGSIEASSGISYTEKEFNYAVEHKIPILAFVIANDVSITPEMTETDPVKAAGLVNFKTKVKEGRIVKFWHNADELATQVSQSIYKAIARANRPGWVRTTEFDIEKSYAEIMRLTERVHTLEALNSDLRLQNCRSPKLWISIRPELGEDGKPHDENIEILEDRIIFSVATPDLSDAENGIDYKDISGKKVHVDKNEVRLFRYLYQNVFPVMFRIQNDGNARATGVRVKLEFPNELFTLSGNKVLEYAAEESISFSKDAYEGWNARFYGPKSAVVDNNESKFIGIDELMTIDDIADLLDPSDYNEVQSILPGEVNFDKEEVRHKDMDFIRNVYILPTKAGKFTIKCNIICNEFPDSISQDIIVEVK